MAEEPDLNFDIDALFDHLTNNLQHDINDEQDWHFSIRSANIAVLEEIASELQQEFTVQLQEHVEEVDIDGEVSLGEPLLTIIRRGALTVDEVKQISERVRSLAEKRSLVYEGVDCYEPIDEEELFGWLPPEDAGWRLRHMSDCGLEVNAELPWTFLIVTSEFASLDKVAGELDAIGFSDHDKYDEPDEDGLLAICVFAAGRNNEFELDEASKRISELAERHGAQLEGIQFYTREAVNEIFGGEEDV